MAHRPKEARKKDGRREKREEWQPVPLHLPLPVPRKRPEKPSEQEPGSPSGVVVIDFGG